MNPAPQNEESIFEAARQLPMPEQRAAYLDQTCAGQPELRRRVEQLLIAHEQAGTFLSEPPTSPQPTIKLTLPAEEKPGEKIGHYKLLQEIGEGGCGVVWMAEQEAPVRRRVALKVIKLGMDTKQVVARFEAERQALALMDHPNIAKVLDAGATDTGRPYFVMELVRGVRITDYCDQNNLSTEQRLALFSKVCQAIQHAHQKGIIHRDIKPSNILVADHDGVPVPKVIDFGIAKATSDQRLTDKTLFTAFEQFIGTPAYMSPEQANLSGLDIDTRTDIYSLGVLLYELLTGKTPFDAKELLQAGLDEMRRTIREKEPARPSTRLSTMLAGDLTTTAKHRHTDAPKLIHLVRGDLDWIVMKCLEKDRTRRYETANGLALDVQRHLSNELVTARPPSTAYRFQKLVRRNRLAFAAASAVLGSLILGLVVALWLYYRETQARERAGAEEQKAKVASAKNEESARFLKGILESVGPSVALGRDTALMREVLDKAAARVSTDLKTQPETEAEMRATLGKVYLQLAEYEKAEAMLREALALKRQLLGAEHAETAIAMSDLGRALITRGKRDEGENLLREALELQRKVLGAEHVEVAETLGSLAWTATQQLRPEEAERLGRESLAIWQKLCSPESVEVVESLLSMAEFLRIQRKLDEAEQLVRQAERILSKQADQETPLLADAKNNLAVLLLDQSKLAEAEVLFQEVLVIQRRIYGHEHPRIALTLQNLGVAYLGQQKPVDAEASLSKALAMQLKFRDHARGDVILTAGNLAVALLHQGKRAETDQMIRTLIPPGAENLFEYYGPLSFRAQYYAQSRRFAEAAVEIAAAARLKPDDGLSRIRLSCVRFAAGDLTVFQRERSDMLTRFRSLRDPRVAEHIATACLLAPMAGADLMIAGQLADLAAEQMPDDPWVARTKGLAEYRRGDFPAAQSWAKKALGQEKTDSPTKVTAQTIVALAQLQSGETNAALTTLIAVCDARREMPGLNAMNVFEVNWHNVIIAEILLHEAEATFIPILQQERKFPGQSASHRQLLTDLLQSAGRWDEALALLAERAAREPEDTLLTLQLAIYQTWFGKEAEHAVTSRRFLQYAKGTTNAFTADRASKAFCLRPSSDAALLAEALSLARRAVELGRDTNAMPYFQLALGLAEYRNGHLIEADKAFAAAAQSAKGNSRVQAPAQLFHAMSLFRQGRTNEAQRLFADSSAVFRAPPSDERNPLTSGGNHDDMIIWLAHKEAKALLQP